MKARHTLKALRPLAALALAVAGLGAASQASAEVNCANPKHRDSTCLGSTAANGARPGDNIALSTQARGTNVLGIGGAPPGRDNEKNECVSMALITTAPDPASSGATPVFVTPAGTGYLGSGGQSSPSDYCGSPSDGSCTTWVPASHPFLFVGASQFVSCGSGASAEGSVSCPITGVQSYVSANLSDGYSPPVYMIACKTGLASASTKVRDAPFSWWETCRDDVAGCLFSYTFPYVDNGGGGG